MNYTGFANRVHSEAKGETTLTAIDFSPSMDFNDWKPTRLSGAITANTELIKKKLKLFPDDRVGIIGFGNVAKLMHAPVCLKSGHENLIRALETRVKSDGTNFVAALNLAEKCFADKMIQPTGNPVSDMLTGLFFEMKPKKIMDNNHKRIILLTDGQHNGGGSPATVAQRLKDIGVIIDCIGIGGAPKDVDENLLRMIASQNPDGSVRYCFIGDQDQLISKYESLATHIMPL
ncbi:von Willebrand factor type A domain protein [Limihaloglobus sulfuriphilus]|uniref:von Willebrand factor type A domain protein n=1 Tax=Limihaloglobus sulfuriphilus TaxID=1851148 RepID=A0A1Q2MDZ6_9BACT|nr:vWA domain-containing protein [Limihaloglobus sulfuriphilus]AQQ70915.1 von Willebrand factor type A domain protein [Limihaloglobus sulfuriphilus]